MKIETLLSNPKFDICILKSKNHGMKPLIFASNDILQTGDQVFVVGSPRLVPYVHDTGTIISIKNDDHILLNLEVDPGSSGSPVLRNGKIVGMVVSYTNVRRFTKAVHFLSLKKFLKDNFIFFEE
jgi:S1-C subfamily serine protease